MKRTILAVAMLTAFAFTMSAQNNYSRLWAKVQKAEKEGKPQTAAGYLRELEEKTIKASDELEQLVVAENLYRDLQKYNWKEANAYYSHYATLNRRVMVDSLDAYIVKFADHPRIMMLLQKRLYNHKEALDRRWRPAATGAEYLAVRKEAEELLRHKRVGDWKKSIQSLIDAMDSQSLSTGHYDTKAPGDPAAYTIRSRNVKEAEVKVYRLLDDKLFFGGFKNSNEETLRRNGALVSTQKVGPMVCEYNILEETTVSVDFPEPGVYVVRFAAVADKADEDDCCYDQVFVSNVVGALRTRDGKAEVYAADYHTGKPFGEGRVSVYKNLYKDHNSAILRLSRFGRDDFRGEGFQPVDLKQALTDTDNDYQARISCGKDIYAPLLTVIPAEQTRYRGGEYEYEQGRLFTDRALYKPTDTIHFMLLCYSASQTKGHVVPDKRVKVTLRHVSEKEPVATLEVLTNAMGSAAGSFTLPEGAKNGNYVIDAEYLTSRRVRVEEYKRPNFTVTMDPVTDALCFGDVVRQTGGLRSYAGYSVAGGEVGYRIVRTTHDRTHGRYLGRENLMEGTVFSDGDGRFDIVFPAERPGYKDTDDALLYSDYEIYVNATDPQGETHETRINVPVADVPVELNLELPDNTHFEDRLIVDKDNVKSVLVKGFTLNGTPYSCPVSWSVLAADGTAVQKGEGLSNEPIAFDFGTLPSGDYTVKAATDFRGHAVETDRKVVVMSTDDRKLPFKSTYFYYPIKTEGALDFVLGTSEEDLYLELEIFDNDRQLYREGVHLQNEMRKFSIPYDSAWRSAVKMSVFGIRDGRELNYTYEFTRPGDVRLDVAVETFRDKTTPGSTEKMILRAPAGSELLVSIYDVTTDRYQANSFSFYPLDEYVSVSRPRIQSTISPYRFRAMNDLMMMKGAARAMDEAVMVEAESAMAGGLQDEAESEEETPEFTGRSNFSELVAFCPQVPADPSGRTEISYTVSDLLTTYRVLVMAHDSRMFVGDASAEFIVQQELMVQPNVPLFATEGDRIVLKSKLVNLSSRELKGTAYIEILDDQGKKLKLKGMGSQKRTLLAGAQDEVAWTVEVPGGTGRLTVKIWFVTPTSSDGEQHELTVVPNTITLTEAASFVMGGKHGHKYYEKQLRKQFGAADPKIVYAEYSTLDAVMESLPKAEKPLSDNAIEWINQLYINQMRNFVIKDDPADYLGFRNQAFSRLKVLQSSDGGLQWFPGMRSNTTLTLYFLEKLGQLRQVGAFTPTVDEQRLVSKAISYVDTEIASADSRKTFYPFGLIRSFAVRSLWFDVPLSEGAKRVYGKFIDGTGDGWQDISILEKSQLCNLMLRAAGTTYDDKRFAGRIKLLRESLKDYAEENPTVGCYFPNAVMPYRGLMNSEIYAHAQLIETFGSLGEKKVVDGIAQWLLLQKHNQAWENTVATTDAVHALISSKAKDLKLGAVYYTYTTKLEKVKASANELSVNRTFVRASTGQPLEEGEALHVGDEIIVNYAIYNTENRSFVQMRAMRPASFYPVDERSYYTWYGWYREVKPSETNYYWELLPEEHISVQERFHVTQEGTFNSGLVQIECLYAQEYRGHTDAWEISSK